MITFESLDAWRQFRKSLHPNSLGFVPTMGNLHKGHASLYKRSIEENEITVASIFINPTQFNQHSDFKNYPCTLEDDMKLLESLGVDFCILPKANEIYQDNYAYQMHEVKDSLIMEGECRPGHFNGVLTVVLKLFNLVKPTRAYFGEKDFQQLFLIQKMVASLFLDIEVIPCPTVRETSNLAYSSRNNRLTADQRITADVFAQIFHSNRNIPEIKEKLRKENIEVEYIAEYQSRLFAAVKIGDIRLIDNYSLIEKI